MRRHLNTLYVTTERAWLRKDGENVVVEVDGDERGRVPIHLLGSIVCLGAIGMTPALMGHCAECGVCVSMLSRNGRFLARVERQTSETFCCGAPSTVPRTTAPRPRSWRSHMVTGKLLNQRTVVRRALRDHGATMAPEGRERLSVCERRLTDAARRSAGTSGTDAIRGIEGEAARAYYAVLDDLIRDEDRAFAFSGRSRRPPLDPVNALLSFFYTLLAHDCRSALETVGLDPAVGYLHRERPGRPSLALDLMEELRPVLADRLVLSLINRRQLRARDFEVSVSGAVTMRDDARKSVLVAYQDRKKMRFSIRS